MIGKWKNLVDTLQTDLRSVSSEAKRRHPAVKDAAERAILKLRSLSAANDKHINEGEFALALLLWNGADLDLNMNYGRF